MIFAITGGQICAGRNTFADYLVKKYLFKKIDIFQEYNSFISSQKKQDLQSSTEQSEGDIKEKNTDTTSQFLDSIEKKGLLVSNQYEGIKIFRQFYQEENREELIKFVNKILDKCRADWHHNYIVYPLPLCPELQSLIDAYRITLISIESSTLIRFDRAKLKYDILNLETFVQIDHSFQCLLQKQHHSYKHHFNLANNYESIEAFEKSVECMNFADSEILRPNWDSYFMKIAHVTSSRTNCMKRAVGAVIVQDNRIVATGYNGTPFGMKNCNQGGCERCNSNAQSGVGLDECLCMHAEENAVIEGGRAKTKGGTCYVTTYPCLTCAKSLVQAGIRRIVYDRTYPMPIVDKFINKIEGVILEQHKVIM